jgi:hypothetical protein
MFLLLYPWRKATEVRIRPLSEFISLRFLPGVVTCSVVLSIRMRTVNWKGYSDLTLFKIPAFVWVTGHLQNTSQK